ncbi:MAG: DUF559 domain-containing protein [Alphaproteobacteria bacterium]|nr:DUF559 domain-containing protein [Alphaproteobacteria bacterium]
MSDTKKISTARSLRQRQTDLESRLWQVLRNRRVCEFKFRRQHPVGPYVADFACPEAKLVIEIDGYWHTERQGEDAMRTDRLRSLGYEVVRFETDDAGSDLGPLVQAILQAVKERIADRQRRR